MILLIQMANRAITRPDTSNGLSFGAKPLSEPVMTYS